MQQHDTAPVISVIVPALNEESVIGRCLASLKQQRLPQGAFEVIVVDNGSIDRTAEIARSFGGSMPVTVLERRGVRIAALRNFGAARARGQYLAFLDADCVAPKHWLQQAIDLLHADDSRIVGAQYRIPANSSWVAKAWYGDLWQMKNGPVSYVPGGDLIVSRELFLNLGGFDETIVTSEDCEFCERAARSSVAVLALPSLSVVHLGTPQTLESFYQKQSWHGVNVHRVFLRDMFHSKSRKAMLFALYMLVGIVAAISGSCAGAILGSILAPVAGLAVLLFGPFMLAAVACVERKKWNYLLSLTVLYGAYGVARAMCLLGIGGVRKPSKSDVTQALLPAATALLRSHRAEPVEE
jgi:glycosyltransferase involved in cell wall biosynthesis